MNEIPWSEEGLTVAVDTETSGLFVDDGARVSIVSVAWDEGSTAIPFDQGPVEGKPGVPPQMSLEDILAGEHENAGPAVWDALFDWFTKQHLVFHHAKFDLHMLAAGHRVWGRGRDLSSRFIWDTMLAQRVLDPLLSTSLKPTAQRLWGTREVAERDAVDDYLRLRKWNMGKFHLVPWEVARPYATKDAELTLRLYKWQQDRVAGADADLLRAIDHELALTRVLFMMEERGIGFDLLECAKAAHKLEVMCETIKAGLPFPTTPKGCKDYYFGKGPGSLALIPRTVTPGKGDPVLNIETLRTLAQEGRPYAKELARLRNCESALSKWYANWPNLVGADGRLRTNYNQHKVVSARLSVDRVQLQALPHDYRLPDGVVPVKKLIIAGEGKCLWECDVSQAEMRVATAMAGCKRMRAIIEAGGDLHGETAKVLFGITEENADWDKLRTIAKRINFGTLYGAGTAKVQEVLESEGVPLPMQQVQRAMDSYRERFPEFAAFARKCEGAALRRARSDGHGYIRLLNGRRRYFREDEEMHKAFNQVIQGTVAILVGQWMIAIEKEWPGIMLLQVHDSVVLEIPKNGSKHGGKGVAVEVAMEGASIMEIAMRIPFKVDAKEW